MKPDQRIMQARAACECPYAHGIAFCCAVLMLNPLKLIVRGECCDVKLPAQFTCPRHEIMGW